MTDYKKIYPTYLHCKIYLAELIFPKEKLKKNFLGDPLADKIATDERIIQYIWNERLLNLANAKTCSGKKIEIINPGRWNQESGPDFLQAEIKIDDTIMKGDIEIHIDSADWKRHRHNANSLYKEVILHAFLEKTDDDRFEVLPNGNRAEKLSLAEYLFPGLDEIKKAISGEEYLYRKFQETGECFPVFSRLEPDFMEHFFNLAGAERIKEKIERFKSQTDKNDFDQLFYQALMTSMGHKGTKALFFLLAKRASLCELAESVKGLNLKDRTDAIEAILLHIANLVPPPDVAVSSLDEQSQIYLNTINKWWAEFSGYMKDKIIPFTKRWHSGMRPANFPTRRIAGIARLIAENISPDNKGEFFFKPFYQTLTAQSGAAQDKKALIALYKKIIGRLCVSDETSYWARRFTFRGDGQGAAQDLIGQSSARSVLFNAMLPVAALYSQKIKDEKSEKFVWFLLENFPALSENILTKFMTRRLFGENPEIPEEFFNKEIKQQALFKIFYDACGNNETTCENCSFKSLQLVKMNK